MMFVQRQSQLIARSRWCAHRSGRRCLLPPPRPRRRPGGSSAAGWRSRGSGSGSRSISQPSITCSSWRASMPKALACGSSACSAGWLAWPLKALRTSPRHQSSRVWATPRGPETRRPRRRSAAEGAEGGDRCAALGRQEQEGVVEAAARGGGFLLGVLLRRHGVMASGGDPSVSGRRHHGLTGFMSMRAARQSRRGRSAASILGRDRQLRYCSCAIFVEDQQAALHDQAATPVADAARQPQRQRAPASISARVKAKRLQQERAAAASCCAPISGESSMASSRAMQRERIEAASSGAPRRRSSPRSRQKLISCSALQMASLWRSGLRRARRTGAAAGVRPDRPRPAVVETSWRCRRGVPTAV